LVNSIWRPRAAAAQASSGSGKSLRKRRRSAKDDNFGACDVMSALNKARHLGRKMNSRLGASAMTVDLPIVA
jgi:hypothetical protein